MTTNRTSEAAQTLRSFLSQTFDIEGRPEKEELTLTHKELRAICERFNRMEEALNKAGHSFDCRCITHDDLVDPGGADCDCGIPEALAFDPLSE